MSGVDGKICMNYKWDHFSVLVLINDLSKDDFSHIVYVLNYKFVE